MPRSTLLAYQLLTGASDTSTGMLLIITPGLAIALMRLQAPSGQLVYLSLVGAFVLSIGLSCLYGALVAYRGGGKKELEMIWLLTAFTRASVAVFITEQVLANALGAGWLAVGAFDGLCVLIQAIGLRNGWLTWAAE